MSLFLLIRKKRIMENTSFFPPSLPTFLLDLGMPRAQFTSANIYNLELFDRARSHFQAKLKGMAYATDRSPRVGFSKTVFCEGFRFLKMLSIWWCCWKNICFQISVQRKTEGLRPHCFALARMRSIITVFDSNSNSCCLGSWAAL